MKKMIAAVVISLSLFACTQHDTKSPDTSGNNAQNPNRSTSADSSTTTGDSTMINNGNNQ